ncbi:hypothetical protein [Burkholderia cepacia]|uniref:hypothetical protein n=1 Tax=Burkholderia cepacia TaxID=292 RepID=UPI001575DB77|nr:hypothetical protein [Burkholderia cepacia]NTX20458.1 hypothetical protein [Burkholderia cepacia]
MPQPYPLSRSDTVTQHTDRDDENDIARADAGRSVDDAMSILRTLIDGRGAQLKDAAGGRPGQGEAARATDAYLPGQGLPRRTMPGTAGVRGGGAQWPTRVMPGALAGMASMPPEAGVVPFVGGDTTPDNTAENAGEGFAPTTPQQAATSCATQPGLMDPGQASSFAPVPIPFPGPATPNVVADVRIAVGDESRPSVVPVPEAMADEPMPALERLPADLPAFTANAVQQPMQARTLSPPAPPGARLPVDSDRGIPLRIRPAETTLAEAKRTVARFAGASARRVEAFTSTAGRVLSKHVAAFPGLRAGASTAQRSGMSTPARSSSETATTSSSEADASAAASGNEAAGVVSVVRFVAQAREWLGEQRTRAPANACGRHRGLRCRLYCRAGCMRRGT